MAVSVFVPASIGNVSVGFDVLGLAVKPVDGTLLGDVVTVSEAVKNHLKVVGEFANKLPKDPKQNIVWQCLQLFNENLANQSLQAEPVLLTLDKKMPVGSGLGSSACSVVAALAALNFYYRSPFGQKQLLEMMGQMEAQISGSLHYDNVAPCFLGGLQLMVTDENVISQQLPFFDNCYLVMAYPGIEVSTKAAREVLPEQYSRADVISASQNLATFVDACHRQDHGQAFSVVKDVIAEPYREHLLPGFKEAKQYLQQLGCLAVGISGSGPTQFSAWSSLEQAQQAAKWLQQHYLKNESGFVHVCLADSKGVEQIAVSVN